MLATMEVRASHIFREGNILANILSNFALRFDDGYSSPVIIPKIRAAAGDNRTGKSNYRFR